MEHERNGKDAQIARKVRPPTCVTFEGNTYGVHTCYDISLKGYRGPTPGKCPARVYSPLGNGHSIEGQCQRKGSLECAGHSWCATHYPPNVIKRGVERRARWDRESAERQAKWKAADKADALRERCLEAIKKIAAGHNDPRGLAVEALADPPAVGS